MIIGALLCAWAYTLLKDPPPGTNDTFWGIVWMIIGVCCVLRGLADNEW